MGLLKRINRYINESEENWTKEDLIDLIQQSELDKVDIIEISDFIIELIDDEDEDEEDSNIDEKMSINAKKKAKQNRRKPAFKKAIRLKKKCMKLHGDKVRASKKLPTPWVCGSDGQLKKGMSKAERKTLKKTRRKNKNKVIN